MGQIDDIKGKAKEAAGEVTGDEDLENEGRVDQVTGDVKDKVEDAAGKVKDFIRKD